MSAQEIIEELRANGSQSIKNVLVKHGAKEPFFGVKIEYLKKIQKRVKMDYSLSLDLYATGISDAKYLASLIADDAKMTREDLNLWASQANWSLISENAVPWVAAGNPLGEELALEWIESEIETTACAGWCTLSSIVALKPDSELDIASYSALLKRVETEIHQAPNRVRYCMNGFIISVGSYITQLTEVALETAKAVGKVSVSMGETACRVSGAVESIQNIREKGLLGKKRKSVKC